jgi:hypothetical protein
MKIWFDSGADDTGRCGERLTCDFYLHCGISLEVFHPVRSAVFRNYKKTILKLGEPDFDFPWPAAFAATGSQV